MPNVTYTNFQIDVHGANPNSWSYNPTVQPDKKKGGVVARGWDDGDVTAETFFWLAPSDEQHALTHK